MATLFDLRSDTVSKPTTAMREAMATAEVGDDCYGDDPTINALEGRVAELLGKPAAVFVPSGTMANQLAVAAHTRPGDVVACVHEAHVQVHENAAAARLSGVQIESLGTSRGFAAEALETRIREESCGWPPARVAWVENTLGQAGGVVWPLDSLQAIHAVAREHGRAVHLDGARLWNAHVATGIAMAEYAAAADSLGVCFSKGLGCPVGSALAGSTAFVDRVRELRHAYGGAMRQAGVLAAAAIHALDHHVDRLADDHRRARRLAESLADLPCWTADTPETNIALFRLPAGARAEDLCAPLRDAGVLCYPNKYSEIRLVVHLGLDDAAIDEVVRRVRRTLGDAS